jgi:hypothetical protein
MATSRCCLPITKCPGWRSGNRPLGRGCPDKPRLSQLALFHKLLSDQSEQFFGEGRVLLQAEDLELLPEVLGYIAQSELHLNIGLDCVHDAKIPPLCLVWHDPQKEVYHSRSGCQEKSTKGSGKGHQIIPPRPLLDLRSCRPPNTLDRI